MVGLIDAKQKESASIGYWLYYVTLTFDLTHDLDLGFFKVNFLNGCISGIVGLIDMKWKWWELIRYWAHCMTLPFDHTHDLDLAVSIKVRVWNNISRSGSADWHGTKGMWAVHSWPWYWLCVTMVCCVDVPDSDGVTSKVGVPSIYPVLFGHLMH